MYGVSRNHEQTALIPPATSAIAPALVARQADGEQATPARLLEGAYEIGGVARGGQPDDDVTTPPESSDLAGEDDVK